MLFLVKIFTRILLCYLVLTQLPARAQSDQAITDSLESVLKEASERPEKKLEILLELAYYAQPPELALAYADSLYFLAQKLDSARVMMKALQYSSYSHDVLGKYDLAMEDAIAALNIADSLNSPVKGDLLGVLAQAYHQLQDPENSYHYYRLANEFLEEQDPLDSADLGSNYFNLSDVYLKNNELDSAWHYLKLAEGIFLTMNSELQLKVITGNTGLYFLKKQNLEKAGPYLLEAAKYMESIKYYEFSSEYYNHLAELNAQRGNWIESIDNASRALEQATLANARKHMAEAHMHLYLAYEQTGDYSLAFNHLDAYRKAEDSLVNITTVQRMARERNEYEIASKEKELEIQELRANRQQIISYISVALVVLLGLLVFGLFNRFKYIRRTSKIIEQEKERSDNLLKNILPVETADELKAYGKVSAKQFKSVTVMFVDFCGFTRYSQNMDPDALVKRVDFYFSRFDEIMEKYDLEKIKTLGDAYMCAGGLPFPSEDHARRMILAAFEMVDFVKEFKEEAPDDPTRFDCRIGITTGPVVAGVVGTKKFVYDIWGDTVNIASRMESNSEPGKINVSENTYQIIKDRFECAYRGMVDVKNKGMMKMYFVNRELKVGSRESGVVSRKDYG